MRKLYAWLLLFLPSAHAEWTPPNVKVQLPVQGSIAHPEITESSGMDQSRTIPGRFWTHNDSGGKPRLYGMNVKGEAEGKPIEVVGAKNKDWEDIAVDSKGNIWIADVGNNLNTRRDLTVYIIKEPAKDLPKEVPVERSIRVTYPDQTDFPPEDMNFDAEAVFVFDGKLHLFTKHRSDRNTKLYRLDLEKGDTSKELTLLAEFPDFGVVTAADLHEDTRRLAVLTFTGVWILDRGENKDFLKAKRSYWPLKPWGLRQAEAMCWLDDETLLIGNEKRQLFHLKVNEIPTWTPPVNP